MIEKRVPLKFPPGLYMNGTELEQEGRWVDGNLVRFVGEQGHPQPIGGWSEMATSGATFATRVQAAWHYTTNGSNADIVLVGAESGIYSMLLSGTDTDVDDITPSAGTENTSGTFSFARMNNQILISKAGNAASNLWTWSGTWPTPALATVVTQFSAQYSALAKGVAVSAEQFVVALTQNKVVWADQGGWTVWAPAADNTAGSLDLPTAGASRRIFVFRGQTLIHTTTDLWELEYIGGDLVHGLVKVGDSCGIIGPNAVAASESTLYWMGNGKFFQYDGFVRELPCDIGEHVFGEIDTGWPDVIQAAHYPSRSEIHWHYASGVNASVPTPDKMVIWNYGNGTWSKGTLDRDAVTDATIPFRYKPNQASGLQSVQIFGGTTYWHDLDRGTSVDGAFLESGLVKVGEGDRIMTINKIFPDGPRPDEILTLYSRLERGGSESSVVKTISILDLPLDVRMKARYVRLHQTLEHPDSYAGVPHLGIIESSRR